MQRTRRAFSNCWRRTARARRFCDRGNAARHPGLIQAITAAGHEVAHHTHTHPVGRLGGFHRRGKRELDAGLRGVGAAEVRPTRFRPPAGIKISGSRRRCRRADSPASAGARATGTPARGCGGGGAARHPRSGAGAILWLHEAARAGGDPRTAIPACSSGCASGAIDVSCRCGTVIG